jgi:hypothetical protein
VAVSFEQGNKSSDSIICPEFFKWLNQRLKKDFAVRNCLDLLIINAALL